MAECGRIGRETFGFHGVEAKHRFLVGALLDEQRNEHVPEAKISDGGSIEHDPSICKEAAGAVECDQGIGEGEIVYAMAMMMEALLHNLGMDLPAELRRGGGASGAEAQQMHERVRARLNAISLHLLQEDEREEAAHLGVS